jgi:regulatory protein
MCENPSFVADAALFSRGRLAALKSNLLRGPPQSGRTVARIGQCAPLDAARLEELALAYVARFATSAAKLEAYLKRKLRERGWDGADAPPLTALVDKMVANGFVDDAAFARAKSGTLLRRGYGKRRIDQALHAAGIAEPVRDEVRAGEGAHRQGGAGEAGRRHAPRGAPAGQRARIGQCGEHRSRRGMGCGAGRG